MGLIVGWNVCQFGGQVIRTALALEPKLNSSGPKYCSLRSQLIFPMDQRNSSERKNETSGRSGSDHEKTLKKCQTRGW